MFAIALRPAGGIAGLAVAALLACAAAPMTANAAEPAPAHAPAAAAHIKVSGAWARRSYGKAVNSAAFMTLKNGGKQADRLVGAAAPVAKKVELHTHLMDGGIMRMRPVKGGIALPPGKPVMLAPGGLHIMLIGLKKPLNPGEHFPLTLHFDHSGKAVVNVPVMAAPPKDAAHDMMNHDMKMHGQMKHGAPAN